MRYTVRDVSTPVNSGMFQVYDNNHGVFIGAPHYFKDDVDKTAARLNLQELNTIAKRDEL